MNIFNITYLVWILSEILLNRFTRSGKSDRQNADKKTLLFIWLSIIASIAIAIWVAVRFEWGEGEVFHMISHYYLQRTETRTIRHQAGAGAYFAEKGVAMEPEMAACIQDLTVADVESARASSAFMSNIVIDKKARVLRKRADRSGTAKGE